MSAASKDQLSFSSIRTDVAVLQTRKCCIVNDAHKFQLWSLVEFERVAAKTLSGSAQPWLVTPACSSCSNCRNAKILSDALEQQITSPHIVQQPRCCFRAERVCTVYGHPTGKLWCFCSGFQTPTSVMQEPHKSCILLICCYIALSFSTSQLVCTGQGHSIRRLWFIKKRKFLKKS